MGNNNTALIVAGAVAIIAIGSFVAYEIFANKSTSTSTTTTTSTSTSSSANITTQSSITTSISAPSLTFISSSFNSSSFVETIDVTGKNFTYDGVVTLTELVNSSVVTSYNVTLNSSNSFEASIPTDFSGVAPLNYDIQIYAIDNATGIQTNTISISLNLSSMISSSSSVSSSTSTASLLLNFSSSSISQGENVSISVSGLPNGESWRLIQGNTYITAPQSQSVIVYSATLDSPLYQSLPGSFYAISDTGIKSNSVYLTLDNSTSSSVSTSSTVGLESHGTISLSTNNLQLVNGTPLTITGTGFPSYSYFYISGGTTSNAESGIEIGAGQADANGNFSITTSYNFGTSVNGLGNAFNQTGSELNYIYVFAYDYNSGLYSNRVELLGYS